uniref:Protein kinase domain-containing protein n=1 Tax=Aegilops tauschii subsp. strangulata TaxID=200361 RepID=A0A453HLL9_AEGTS
MKITTIMQFILGLIVCNGHVIICGSLYGNETDQLSLLEFKDAITLDPKQSLMSWNDSTHSCSWEGVHCRMKNPYRVTSLNLTNRDSRNHKLFAVLKVLIPIACMVSLAMVVLLLLFWRGRHKRKSMSSPSLDRSLPKVSFSDIARATEGFSTSSIIGRGRYGTVYQGKLFQDGSYVAIKVFNLETRGAPNSFIAECNVLRNVRHRNLVPILTACSSIDSNGNDFKALVYEFMPRGDLHGLLYSTQDYESSLECATGGHISTASDVYSFGIVLFEIFLRKRPTDDMFKDGLNIVKFVEMNFPARISEIIEPEVLQDQPEFPEKTLVAVKENDLDCVSSVLNIGLRCTKSYPNERPNMQEVAAGLHGIKEAYLRGY